MRILSLIVLDVFIEEAIEANGCFCGGGGREDKLDMVVELGKRSSHPNVKWEKIKTWLDGRPDVKNICVSDEFDAWRFADLRGKQ
jgi:uncharacterized protein YggL (DUF469 family)